MVISAAAGHPYIYLPIIIIGGVIISFFGHKIPKATAHFIANTLFLFSAVFSLNTTSEPFVNFFGSNQDIVFITLLSAYWGWALMTCGRKD